MTASNLRVEAFFESNLKPFIAELGYAVGDAVRLWSEFTNERRPLCSRKISSRGTE